MSFTLKFDGKSMPKPMYDTFKITREKVWSENTRRTSNAKMTGTIKAIKTTLHMDFPPDLTIPEIEKIVSVVDSDKEWHTIEFTNERGTVESGTFYFGNPQYGIRMIRKGRIIYSSITIEAVER